MKEVFQKESNYRALAYVKSFQDILVKHPRLINIFRHLEKRMKEKIYADQASVGSSLEDQGVKITVIDKDPPLIKPPGSYFKVEVEGEAFFVKTVSGFYDQGDGVWELNSLNKAKNLLRNMKDVEVVDFQLGYQDKDSTYFVSRWEEGVVLDEYLEKLQSIKKTSKDEKMAQNATKELVELKKRYDKIVLLLRDAFTDVHEHNMLYNPQTKKLKIFDIFH